MRTALLLLAMLQQDYQAEGIQALDAKKFAEAIAAFEKATVADAKDFGAFFYLALAHSMAGHNRDAIANYRKTLELKPGLYEAQLNLGIVLIGEKQAEAAVPLLEAAVNQKPKEFRPVYFLAEALLAAGQNEAAEKRFRAAIEIDPKDAAAQAGLGRALLHEDKLKEAEAAMQQAGDRNGLLELAGIYEKRKDRESAIAIYRKFQDVPAVKQRLGELLLDSGSAGDAIPNLEAAAKSSPTPANFYALATAYFRDKQMDKAAATMERALSAEPGNIEMRLEYAGMLRSQRKFDPAAQQFYAVTKLKPDSKEAWSGVATMLMSLENYPGAVAAFDKIESLGDPNPSIYFFRAIAYDRTKQLKPAIADYQKFLTLCRDKYPDEEFKARQRARILQRELSKR